MPELPDITIYMEAGNRFIGGHKLTTIQIRSPFVLRTFDPDVHTCEGQTVRNISRLGKRIVWELSDDLFLVFHLMVSGRFHWRKPGTKPTRKVDLAAFHFAHGTILLTEASQKKQAALHVHRGRDQLQSHCRAGLSVLDCTVSQFHERLISVNRTLKKALTDPALFDGIGNAYSDEILHAARLSPLRLTSQLSAEEIRQLCEAARITLNTWIQRLRKQVGDRFPERVTAFHTEMAVHGKFKKPCPDCGTQVQRIVSGAREFNYCPECQTEGRILKDRSLSRLLHDDWPGTIDN